MKKIKLSGTVKNVAKISSGTMMGQIINFITVPIFSRLYGAKIIGIWTALGALLVIINAVSDLGLTNAVMTQENDEMVEKTYKVVSTIVAGVSFGAAIILVLYYCVAGNEYNVNLIYLWIYILVNVFATQQTQICYTWLNRKGEYSVLMKNPMITNGVMGVVGIGLAYMGFKLYGYSIAGIVSQVATLVHMKRYLPRVMFTFKKQDYIDVFKENKRFVQYQLPTNILSNVKNQIPTLMLKRLWGAEVVGYYSITYRLMQMPCNLLANAIGRVFFQKTSEMKRQGKELGAFVYKSLVNVMKIAIVPIILLMSVGDIVIVIFLGKSWEPAGIYIRILALQCFFLFLMQTVQGISMTLEKQNYAMLSCIAQGIGSATGLILGKYVFHNVYIGVALFSAIFIIINIIYFCALFVAMKVKPKNYVIHVLLSVFVIISCAWLLRTGLEQTGILGWFQNYIGTMKG